MGYFYVSVIVCAVSIYAYVQMKKGEVLRFETVSTAEQVVMAAVGQVGTARRWATVTQSPTNVAFSYKKRPSLLITFLLAWFFLIPAIVYWTIRSKVESLNTMIVANPSGNTQVQITSNGYQGKSAGRAVRDAVGIAPGTVAQAVDSENSTIPMVAGTTVGLVLPAAAAAALPVGMVAQPVVELASAGATPSAPAGWYPDPENAGQQRYFDGQAWTEHRA